MKKKPLFSRNRGNNPIETQYLVRNINNICPFYVNPFSSRMGETLGGQEGSFSPLILRMNASLF